MSSSGPKDENAPNEAGASPGPGAEEPRRHFLKVLGIGGIGAGLATVIGAPAIAALAYPLGHATVSEPGAFLSVGKRSRFAGGRPVKVDLFADRVDGWNRVVQVRVGSAWLVDDGQKVRAFSTVCPHLGCAVDFDAEETKFKCPCHRSAFTLGGSVEGGPSPRPMDELEVKTEGDQVLVRYLRFKQGIAKKETA